MAAHNSQTSRISVVITVENDVSFSRNVFYGCPGPRRGGKTNHDDFSSYVCGHWSHLHMWYDHSARQQWVPLSSGSRAPVGVGGEEEFADFRVTDALPQLVLARFDPDEI